MSPSLQTRLSCNKDASFEGRSEGGGECADYLGSDQPNFTLNFSKSASMVVAQYYQFLRLGFEGYKKIMISLLNVAARLQKGIEALGEAPRPRLADPLQPKQRPKQRV